MIVCPLSSKQSDFSPLYVFDHQGNPMIVQSLPQFLDLSLCHWITGNHGIQTNIEGMLMGLLEALYDYLSVGASAMKFADERKQVVMHRSHESTGSNQTVKAL